MGSARSITSGLRQGRRQKADVPGTKHEIARRAEVASDAEDIPDIILFPR